MLAATAAMELRAFTGSDMYDLLGSLSVFGFLTAYALVAARAAFCAPRAWASIRTWWPRSACSRWW